MARLASLARMAFSSASKLRLRNDVSDTRELAAQKALAPGPLDDLAIAEQLFIEFLAGAQADIFDGDIDAGAQARKLDQPFGQFGDQDRLAHVQHEDPPPLLSLIHI